MPWSYEGAFHRVPNEIICIILHNLALADIFNFALCARRLRGACQYVTAWRIYRHLQSFFGTSVIDLMETFATSASMIFGSIPAALYLQVPPLPLLESDCNIATPVSFYNLVRERLITMPTFVRFDYQRVPDCFSNCVDSCVAFFFNVSAINQSHTNCLTVVRQ